LELKDTNNADVFLTEQTKIKPDEKQVSMRI